MQEDQNKHEESGIPQNGGEGANAPEGAASGEGASSNPNMKWYIIHSYSGFERKVKESLESRVLRLACKERSAAC